MEEEEASGGEKRCWSDLMTEGRRGGVFFVCVRRQYLLGSEKTIFFNVDPHFPFPDLLFSVQGFVG